MHVLELWRYPVKSMGGERLDHAEIGPIGIPHDRGWGVVDDTTGNVLTGRREPRLLMASARVRDGDVEITTAEGEILRNSDDLTDWLDRPVSLVAAAGREGGHYENPLDAENDADWATWQGPADAWHDSGRARVSIVGTDTLRDWDFRRFRSNVLVEGGGEDEMVGRRVTLGSCALEVTKPVSRCVMVTRPQPGLERDLDVLRAINAERGGCLAIGAVVVVPGVVAPGDELEPA